MHFLFSSKEVCIKGTKLNCRKKKKKLEIKLKFDFILNNFEIRQSETCERRYQAENIQQKPDIAHTKLNIFH